MTKRQQKEQRSRWREKICFSKKHRRKTGSSLIHENVEYLSKIIDHEVDPLIEAPNI